jgi:glutamate synthase domain-containing protein 2
LAQINLRSKQINPKARIGVKCCIIRSGTIAAGVAKAEQILLLITVIMEEQEHTQTSVKYVGIPWEMGPYRS